MTISEDLKPSSFAFNNTERCQSRCTTCWAWETPASVMDKELTTQEWKDIISKMHTWLGNFNFIFSGGEPFLRNDIYELTKFASNLGISVDVVTNGLALSDKAEILYDAGFNVVVFSLNAVQNPALHIESRGRKDSFKKTMDAIQNLNYLIKKKNSKTTISLSTILMPSNLSEIKPLAEFAKTEGVGVTFQLLDNGDAFTLPPDSTLVSAGFSDNATNKAVDAIELMIELKKQNYPIYNGFPQLEAFKNLMMNLKPAPNVDNDLNKNTIETHQSNISNDSILESEAIVQIAEANEPIENKFISDEKIDFSNEIPKEQEFIVQTDSTNELIEEDQSDIASMKCQVGYNNFSVDPYGNVRICFCFEPIGSLREDSPENLWKSEKAEALRDRISKCKRSCKLLNCNFKD